MCAAARRRATTRRPGRCCAPDVHLEGVVNRIATVSVQATLSRRWVNPDPPGAAFDGPPRVTEDVMRKLNLILAGLLAGTATIAAAQVATPTETTTKAGLG